MWRRHILKTKKSYQATYTRCRGLLEERGEREVREKRPRESGGSGERERKEREGASWLLSSDQLSQEGGEREERIEFGQLLQPHKRRNKKSKRNCRRKRTSSLILSVNGQYAKTSRP